MKYTVYKTTNLVNQKIYIGCHKTKDPNDNYLGSGKLLKAAIEKYGIENFKKKILFVFDTEQEMFAKEAELVTEEFCKSDENYNLCSGGSGGWSYLNRERLNISENQKIAAVKHSHIGLSVMNKPENKYKKLLALEKANKKRNKKTFFGKSHSDETKKQMSLSHQGKHDGSKNSQYGTMWITNGIESRKIKKVDTIPEGWYKGRNCG